MKGRKAVNVLFNNALRDNSYGERGNPLPPLQELFFPINSKALYKHHPTVRIVHTMVLVTPAVDHRVEREIA